MTEKDLSTELEQRLEFEAWCDGIVVMAHEGNGGCEPPAPDSECTNYNCVCN